MIITHRTRGGIGVTTITCQSDLEIFERAILKHGDDELVIVQTNQGFLAPCGMVNYPALCDLNKNRTRDLSEFWRVFREVKAELTV